MKQPELFSVMCSDGLVRIVAAKGRDAWALDELIKAGEQGCTPIDTPGPRWSSYVHKLRALGLAIVTVREAHGGPYKGTHARYILQSVVRRVAPGEASTAGQAVSP